MSECDRTGCAGIAKWRPILLLRPRDYEGPPARLKVLIGVCDAHREQWPDPFITEESWKQILDGADAAGMTRPHRIRTLVEYEQIPIVLEHIT
jgi:hypothetical protein